MKKNKSTSVVRKIELIQKASLSNKEIMELLECGYPKSKEIINEIAEDIKPKKLPGLIPTSLIIRHMRIDVNLLIKTAQFTNNQEAING